MTDLGWPGLTSAALVGTARRAVPASTTGVRSRTGAAPEVELLDQAALVGAARRASRVPERLTAPTAASPDEAREPTPRQTQLLAVSVLQSPVGAGMRTALLVHWCERAARAGVHSPAALLPDLLERASSDPRLRPALGRVLDHRGRWLASQNPAWTSAIAAETGASRPEVDWGHLPSSERSARLSQLRATDPRAARELLASTWGRESAKERIALLACLAIRLAPDDEPFLEQALDDPAAGVRQQAALLLTRLPDSARASRMRARLAPLISQRGLLRKTLNVELPDESECAEPDREALRDGLGKAPPGRSQRDWWLHQLITGAPLSFWTEVTAAQPAAAASRVHQDEVMRGLVSAAVAQQDPAWAEALLAHAQGRELAGLLTVLPAAVLEERAIAQLPGTDIPSLRSFLNAVPAFSPELSRHLVASMSRPMPSARFVLLERDLLRRLHPACVPELLLLARRTDLTPHEHRVVADLVQLFSVQQSISEAFA